MLRNAVFIARSDLAFMLRQRETLLWVFLMPVVFFYFIGTVTGGFNRPPGDLPDPIALAAPAHGDLLVDELVRRLEQQNFRVVRAGSDEAFATFARRLTIRNPSRHASVTAAVAGGEQVEVVLDRRSDPLAADFDRVRVSRAVYGLLADLAVMKTEGQPVTAEAFQRLAGTPRPLTLAVKPAGRRTEPPLGFSQAIPGTMVMFTMLVLLTSGAIALVVEREAGLLRRLASAPISRGSVVLGKWTARMALGLVQVAFAAVIGRVLFGVDWGRSLGMVSLVLVAWAAFNASLAILLGTVARTPAQMAGIGVISTMTLAALGGCWWPIEVAPEWMRTLSLALPTGWTMDALHKLVNFGDPARAAVPHVAALLGAAFAAGAAGARLFRYQ
jgi:ABC-type Na+ efflux pump permease subunit